MKYVRRSSNATQTMEHTYKLPNLPEYMDVTARRHCQIAKWANNALWCGDVRHCIGVLPFLDHDYILMVRQYRYVQQENHRWEMPTGGMRIGEAPEHAALRELQEEIGYIAHRLEWVSSYYTSKSICDETAHLYLGYDLTPALLPADETEFFEIAALPFAEVLDLVLRSKIRDGITIIAVLRAARLRATQ